MVWFQVCDTFWSHPKTLDLDPAAGWLWLRCGSYCAQHLTDGFVSNAAIAMLGGTQADATSLVFAGLWMSVQGGYRFHDWDKYQQSRDVVVAKRAAVAERQRRHRSDKSQDSGDSHGVSNGHVTRDVTRDRQRDNTPTEDVTPLVTRDIQRDIGLNGSVTRDMTRDLICPSPSPIQYLQTPSNVEPSTNEKPFITADAVTEFETFWNAYPRKVGKASAKKSFANATKRAPAAEIIAGAQTLADDPNLPGKQFIPHPATWLNRDGWTDEPCPDREIPAQQLPTPQPPKFDRTEYVNPDATPPPANLRELLKGSA